MKRPAPGRADPLMSFRGQCEWCGHAILWAHDAQNGKRFPLNEGPSYFGNITTHVEPGRHGARARPARLIATTVRPGQLAGARADGQRLYRSHLNDCPLARTAARRRPNRRKTR